VAAPAASAASRPLPAPGDLDEPSAPSAARAPNAPSAPSAPSAAREDEAGDKDGGVAFVLSAGTTLAGALMLSGSSTAGPGAIAFLVGPTVGHVYAGQTWSPWLGLRLASVGMPLLGALYDSTQPSRGCDLGCGGLALGVLLGAAVYTTGMIGEIIDAPYAARRHNEAEVSLTVTPIATRTGTAPGIGLIGSF
jgi:hypothetical protein